MRQIHELRSEGFLEMLLKVPMLQESLLSAVVFRAFYDILREIPRAKEQKLDETGIISILFWVSYF